MNSEFWKEHMLSFGKFFHLLPPSFLENFQIEETDLDKLASVDSSLLSYQQV